MTAFGIDLHQPYDLWKELRSGMRDALRSPGVLAVLIVCSTILGLALISGLVFLAWTQRDATTILTMVNMVMSVFLLKRVGDVNGRVTSIEKQTNGHTTRLMDAALGQKEN